MTPLACMTDADDIASQIEAGPSGYRQVSVAAPKGHWVVNVTPPAATNPGQTGMPASTLAVIRAVSTQRSQLTVAGKAAVLSQLVGYQTPSNLILQHAHVGAAQARQAACGMSSGNFWYSCLPADAANQAAAIVAILQTAVNVT